MNISNMQRDIEEFSIERGFDKATLEQRTIYLMTEVGEIAKEVIKISYDPNAENIEEIKENLGFEMYDAVWNICSLANKLGIDLEESFKKKSAILDKRVW